MTQSVLTEEILPLPRLLVEPVVRAALIEDLGRAGDITTDAIVPPGERMRGVIASRQDGVISGTDAAAIAFALIDPAVTVTVERGDGARVAPGDVVLRLDGPARAILTAERVALNLLCRMSGVATATNGLVEAARPHGKASIVCTRKTTPGLRALEKHAVRAGGGSNHRFGLDDAVLIKDNHVAVAGGIVPAIQRARARAGHLVKIECEVDSLEQLEEALSVGVDAVLLDNMGPDLLTRAVAMIDGRALSEASGRITRETVGAVAASGVDLISCGWITHSAAIIDLGLDAA
ncbi:MULTISPECIES: carboxylating nicotinate-nucleotide diphosphorylase [unclassified Methylobacterium]|uniref:carboxylating nicotinate-nucleotide diphosphorylase n=1 Tax=unclassified Methylobacterium TaxID=2615210 RepID=UPI0011C1EA8E|nr:MULTISPECIES: carboxylating nicotinate-nucleotide diphosphorylase [unclassified Methylobacterium]QEE40548.1 carboxylating nicotinate-nucleotide diphosphorylase [Methylobacterium sp. WL1]TXN59256.1 carboxylating nicotinate-nucleotide diphosphorylase [Methylobacterium sp. WL2]